VAKPTKAPEKINMDYTQQEQKEHGFVFDLESLYDYLLKIKDTRKAKGKRYTLISLLILMLLAKLGGEDKPSGMAEWIRHRKELWVRYELLAQSKTASHMTYRRVLKETISPEEFEELVQAYHRHRLKTEQEMVISIDGKSMRGTIPYGEQRGVHLLAAYVPGQGLVLAQAEVDKKENEIVVAPRIVSELVLSGAIIVADAMHAQKAFSNQVVEAGADFIWTVKGNQSRTRWAIEKLFVHEVCNLQMGAPLSKDVQSAAEVKKQHGRVEQRTILTSTQLNKYLDWPHVAQVIRIERVVNHAHPSGITRQIVYGLTSLSPERASPEKLLALFREYWQIESGLHYRRDVTLREDATRFTNGKAAHNMAILNNLVIGLCLSSGCANLASARRYFDAHPRAALDMLISANPPTL
jgi:predicted transposase YbfD/YdcC